ncbi:MAG: CoA transferase [Xanthobacteraceae bacterium]
MYDLLKGLRVVEGASFIAAPLCGLTFVQLGADVIRFDPIGGGPDFQRHPLAPSGFSFYWEGLNKGKRSIAIDLARPEGREIAAALIGAPGPQAGLFVTNYPTNSFLSHAALSARRKDLITVRVTGSTDGRNAVDYTINSATGFPDMTGPVDSREPTNHVLPAWDVAAGLTAAVSLLAAAHRRANTGEGREIHVPLSNVAFGTLSALGNIGEVATSGQDRPRYGNALYGSFGRDFRTADGARLMIVAITRRQWAGLIDVLALKDEIAAIEKRHGVDFLRDEGARFTHRDELFAVVAGQTQRRSVAELVEAFDRTGVCWGKYNTVREALETDQRLSTANPLFENISHPSGKKYIAAGFPGVLPASERAHVRPAPKLGAHTDEILAGELGLPPHEIGRLHDAGIVAGPADQ